jgi:hypothetical protein
MILVTVAATLGLFTAGTLLLCRELLSINAAYQSETFLDASANPGLVALGVALAALQTNQPPSLSFQCKLSVTVGGVQSSYDASYQNAGAQWNVTVVQPSVASTDCPAAF